MVQAYLCFILSAWNTAKGPLFCFSFSKLQFFPSLAFPGGSPWPSHWLPSSAPVLLGLQLVCSLSPEDLPHQKVSWAVTSVSVPTKPPFFLIRVTYNCAISLACEIFIPLGAIFFNSLWPCTHYYKIFSQNFLNLPNQHI